MSRVVSCDHRIGDFVMSSDAASFIGNIPEHYDRGLGPIFFGDYAADIAHRAAGYSPARVLETAAGTGIDAPITRYSARGRASDCD